MTPWTFTPAMLQVAIRRDEHELTAVLMPDGETVLAPDEDLGFTVSLDVWRAAGGRELAHCRYPPRESVDSDPETHSALAEFGRGGR